MSGLQALDGIAPDVNDMPLQGVYSGIPAVLDTSKGP